MVGNLSGDNAQSFIDVIDEVSLHTISRLKDKSADFDLNIPILSIRHWIASNQRSAGGACALFTRFAAAEPCFHGH